MIHRIRRPVNYRRPGVRFALAFRDLGLGSTCDDIGPWAGRWAEMSSDSSRDVTVRSGEPIKKNDDGSGLEDVVRKDVAARVALPPTIGAANQGSSSQTGGPRSGRLQVARLPVVEKDVYQIDGEVARGGIGRVLAARDERLDRRVAVKVLLEESGDYEDRFVREALVTARLQHPAIVPVYEAGRWPTGEPFYAMKLVSGKPLLEIIEECRTLDERLPLLTRVLAVADAMAYAHERHIIHRDLKPANILVGAHGETVLIDWGLAKDLRESNASSSNDVGVDLGALAHENNALTMMGSVMGTPSYMPPEQAAGDSVDERADVYALGAILYHVLSGKQPYAGYDGLQTIMRVLEEPPQALEALQGGIPRDLLTIIEKAMHRERDLRYPTAKEFAEDLRRFLAGQLVGAHHYSSRERVIRFVRKYRAAFAVACVAVVLMAFNGALFVSRIVKERDRAENERHHAEVARQQSIAAEEHATARADELTLVEARAAVERDPNAALAWLKALSPAFRKWSAARIIAADAWSRGTSTTYRIHREMINGVITTEDEKFLLSASDDHMARIVNLENGSSRTLDGHTDEVWSIGLSSDGNRVVTASKDRSIRLWDFATGKLLRTMEGHTAGIVYARFAHQDKVVFSQSDDCTLRMWDVEAGTSRILASGKWVALKSVVGPDERHFLTAGQDGTVWLVDLDNPEPKRISALSVNWHVVQVGGKYPMIFSADGRRALAGGVDGIVREWDFQAEKLHVYEGQTDAITRVAYSPDGRLIVAASADGSLRVWDRISGTSRLLPAQEANVSVLAFSPDGTMLAAAGYDRAARIIDLSNGSRRRFVGMQDTVSDARFTKDGMRLIIASGEGAVRIFQLRQESGRLLAKHSGPALAVDVSPRGDSVVSAGVDGQVRLVSTSQNEPSEIGLSGHIGAVPIVRFSPDGELILSSGMDNTARLWDRSGHQIQSISVPGTEAMKVAFSPDGRLVALGSTDGVVKIWDIDSGALRQMGPPNKRIIHLAFSPDGRQLGMTGSEQMAGIWDVETGQYRDLRGHEFFVSAIAFSPDGGTVVTGGGDHRLRFWDSGATEPRTYDASGYTMQGLIFLPDGASILGNNGNGYVRRWDVASGKTLQTFRGHRGNVTSLRLSNDARALVTSSDDRTVRIYDIETGENRVIGMHDASVRQVAIDPRGSWVVSVGEDGAVRLWSDDLPREPEQLRTWIASAVTDVIDVNALGEGAVPLR